MSERAMEMRLREQAGYLLAIVRRCDPAALAARPDPAQWSGIDIVAHLGRYNELLLERLGRISSETAPRLPRYRAEEDPQWPAWRGLSIDETVRRYRTSRARLTRVVAGLTHAQWRRIGVHPLFGRLTVTQWLNFFLVHEGHHIYRLLLQTSSRK